jgi:hypothetical protein
MSPRNTRVLDSSPRLRSTTVRFTFDRSTSGHCVKWLSIVDEYTRRCFTLDVSRSMTRTDVGLLDRSRSSSDG